MKIRTDFVTNSSSNCSAEVMIDNLLLLEILQRYKDLGVFGDAELDFDIGSLGYSNSANGTTKTPAFHYDKDDTANLQHPDTLDKVLVTIIEIMDWCGDSYLYDQDLYREMKAELMQKGEEIKSGYSQVIFTGYDYGTGDCEPQTGDPCDWNFQYDPINGEKYEVQYHERENFDQYETEPSG